jgi:hypothetical protein
MDLNNKKGKQGGLTIVAIPLILGAITFYLSYILQTLAYKKAIQERYQNYLCMQQIVKDQKSIYQKVRYINLFLMYTTPAAAIPKVKAARKASMLIQNGLLFHFASQLIRIKECSKMNLIMAWKSNPYTMKRDSFQQLIPKKKGRFFTITKSFPKGKDPFILEASFFPYKDKLKVFTRERAIPFSQVSSFLKGFFGGASSFLSSFLPIPL